MSLPSASDAALTAPPVAPSAEAVARFAADLTALCDPQRDTVLVAVSGGGDSLALLLLAQALLGDRCIAATVDHGLRTDAAREAAWVAEVCAARSIAHTVLAGLLPERTGRSANVSARARVLRYRLLGEHAAAVHAALIATAHHADDQVETLAMRLNRGAGVGGLAGVRPRTGNVVRPLLGWRRTELAAIVAAAGLEPVADPSNTNDRFDRARLRKALAGADWIDPARWSISAGALADADAALAWMADRLAAERCGFGNGAATFDPTDLPAELIRRLATRCLAYVDAAIAVRGAALTMLIAALGRGETAMLGDVSVRVDGRVWRFSRAPARRSG